MSAPEADDLDVFVALQKLDRYGDPVGFPFYAVFSDGPRRGEIVPLDIEILPSGTRFGPGETLRLVIQGTDIYRQPRPLVQALHDDSVNRGAHLIHTGGRFDSHLLIPRAPG